MPKVKIGASMVDGLFKWVALPFACALSLHTLIWALGSFVAWDVFWLSAFDHRIMFVVLLVSFYIYLIKESDSDA